MIWMMAMTMFVTGVGLHGRDFLRAGRLPAAALPGLALQTMVMPLLVALAAFRLMVA